MPGTPPCPRCKGKLQWDGDEREYTCIECSRTWFECQRCEVVHTRGQCVYQFYAGDTVELVTPETVTYPPEPTRRRRKPAKYQ